VALRAISARPYPAVAPLRLAVLPAGEVGVALVLPRARRVAAARAQRVEVHHVVGVVHAHAQAVGTFRTSILTVIEA